LQPITSGITSNDANLNKQSITIVTFSILNTMPSALVGVVAFVYAKSRHARLGSVAAVVNHANAFVSCNYVNASTSSNAILAHANANPK
jgi:hypothetical protein